MTGEINLECLFPGTRQVLKKLSTETDFLSDYVLVGGPALSIRLCHRFSEDLDFFTYADDFDKRGVFEFFQGKNYLKPAHSISKQQISDHFIYRLKE